MNKIRNVGTKETNCEYRTIEDTILEKLKAIQNKPKPLDILINRCKSHNLKELLFWLMQHGYDTFICSDVLKTLGQPAKSNEWLANELNELVKELKDVFSGCLSIEPCTKGIELAIKTKSICSHVEGKCRGTHVTINEYGNIINFFRLIALIFWAGHFSKFITIEARGGGCVQKG